MYQGHTNFHAQLFTHARKGINNIQNIRGVRLLLLETPQKWVIKYLVQASINNVVDFLFLKAYFY